MPDFRSLPDPDDFQLRIFKQRTEETLAYRRELARDPKKRQEYYRIEDGYREEIRTSHEITALTERLLSHPDRKLLRQLIMPGHVDFILDPDLRRSQYELFVRLAHETDTYEGLRTHNLMDEQDLLDPCNMTAPSKTWAYFDHLRIAYNRYFYSRDHNAHLR